VPNRRVVTIDATADRSPEGDVQVEGLRKVEQGYLITPNAEIPFVGRVLDDQGLEQVEYEGAYETLDAPPGAAARAARAAGLMLFPTTPGGPAAVPTYVPLLMRVEQRVELPKAPLASFAQLVGSRAARAPRLSELKRLLHEPPGESLIVRQFEVRPER